MAEEKKKKWLPFIIGGLIFIFLLFLGTCTGGMLSPLPYCHLDPFFGKVIDADTKEPIEGAVVLAAYYKTAYTVAGSNSYVIDGQETLTDEQGEFKIPWKIRWFAPQRGYTEGNLTIFMPGYGVFPRHKRSQAVGENKSWPPPDKYIVYELPKLKTLKERKNNMIFRQYNEIPYQRRKRFVHLINEEYSNLGLPGISIPKKEE